MYIYKLYKLLHIIFQKASLPFWSVSYGCFKMWIFSVTLFKDFERLFLCCVFSFCRCLCGNCQQMTTPRENLCCRTPRSKVLKSMDLAAINCICQAGKIRRSCFVRDVLLGDADLYEIHVGCLPIRPQSTTCRYISYRRFVQLIWKTTGSGNRKVLPSCFVTTVRRHFPSANGQYAGFKD